MTAANDAKQRALGSGTAAAALRVPAFVAVKLAMEPPEMLSGAPLTSVNAIDRPVLVGKLTRSDVKTRLGAVAFREAEFPLPDKTALANVAVRKSLPAHSGRVLNVTIPEKF